MAIQILQVHMDRRQITGAGFHCVLLFCNASDKGAFHDQWHKRADGTELNVPDVANGTIMVAFMHPKNTSYLTF